MRSISKLSRELNCEADLSTKVNAASMVSLGRVWMIETSDRARRDAWAWSLIALILPVLFVSGCASSKSGDAAPRPGDGVRDYHRLVLDLRKDVAALRESAQAVSTASTAKAPAAYPRFDESLHRLEVFSIKARARAEVLEKRGHAYFDEWAEEISESPDPAAREKARARFGELRQHFEAVLNDSRQARQEFRQFLELSRGLRSKLGQEPAPPILEQAKPTFDQLVSAARQTEGALDQLAKALKTAEAAVMSGAVPAVKTGGKS